MNKAMLAALSAALVVASPLHAQPTNPAERAASAKPAPPNPAEFDKQMAQVQENMKTLQEQMDKIRQTQDSQERQKLLQEHWTTMQNNMQLMYGMWGPGMMGCCAGVGHMTGGYMMGGPMMGWQGYLKLTPDQMKQRQYMMNQYIGIQQMMMDHMMQHQQYMWTR